MTINCERVSQDRLVFKGEADIVVIPGMDGQMGILPKHAPVLTALDYGVITVRLKGVEEHFTVAGGIAEVLPEKITILAYAAENVEEIDIERATRARERAEERLKQIMTSDTDRYLRVSSALKRSTLRLPAAQKYRKTAKPRI